MRVLITGGSGFVGSHLCESFLADGHQVVCVDNYLTGAKENTDALLEQSSFTRLEADVTRPFEIEGAIDAVLHFASPASPADFARFPLETLRVGSDATFLCAELALRHQAKLLLASTSEVYGDPLEHPQRETYWGHVNSIGIRSVYDEAKRFSESVVMAYHRKHGLDTRIVRIFNTYGPRMQLDDGRALPSFCQQALAGEPITIYGDGSQTRSFCYVSDLVAGVRLLLDSDFNEPVNIGNPVEITIRELVDEVIELTDSKSTITYNKLPSDDPRQRRPDITRAKKLLGWQPQVDRREGLTKMIDFVRNRLAKRT